MHYIIAIMIISYSRVGNNLGNKDIYVHLTLIQDADLGHGTAVGVYELIINVTLFFTRYMVT